MAIQLRPAFIGWIGFTVIAALIGGFPGPLGRLFVTRAPFLHSMIRRYAMIKWTGIGVITVTGIVQWLARMQANRGFWSALNIACGLTILIGAALMRSVAKVAP